MRDNWTDAENDTIVAEYFAMLTNQEAGQPYSKAEHNRMVAALTGRPRGAIEYKHQNISAVLKGLGESWIQGYEPAYNFQGRWSMRWHGGWHRTRNGCQGRPEGRYGSQAEGCARNQCSGSARHRPSATFPRLTSSIA